MVIIAVDQRVVDYLFRENPTRRAIPSLKDIRCCLFGQYSIESTTKRAEKLYAAKRAFLANPKNLNARYPIHLLGYLLPKRSTRGTSTYTCTGTVQVPFLYHQ